MPKKSREASLCDVIDALVPKWEVSPETAQGTHSWLTCAPLLTCAPSTIRRFSCPPSTRGHAQIGETQLWSDIRVSVRVTSMSVTVSRLSASRSHERLQIRGLALE